MMDEVPPKELYNINWKKIRKEKSEAKKAIQLFWWCSTKNKWEWFDFDEIFEILSKTQKYKIKEFIYRKIQSNILKYLRKEKITDDECDELLDITNNIENVSREKVNEVMYKVDKIGGATYRNWTVKELESQIETLRQLTRHRSLSKDEKISLFDSLIHLEHDKGNMWSLDNIDRLRKKFKEEYL